MTQYGKTNIIKFTEMKHEELGNRTFSEWLDIDWPSILKSVSEWAQTRVGVMDWDELEDEWDDRWNEFTDFADEQDLYSSDSHFDDLMSDVWDGWEKQLDFASKLWDMVKHASELDTIQCEGHAELLSSTNEDNEENFKALKKLHNYLLDGTIK